MPWYVPLPLQRLVSQAERTRELIKPSYSERDHSGPLKKANDLRLGLTPIRPREH